MTCSYFPRYTFLLWMRIESTLPQGFSSTAEAVFFCKARSAILICIASGPISRNLLARPLPPLYQSLPTESWDRCQGNGMMKVSETGQWRQRSLSDEETDQTVMSTDGTVKRTEAQLWRGTETKRRGNRQRTVNATGKEWWMLQIKKYKAIDKVFEGYINRTVMKRECMRKVKETHIIVKATEQLPVLQQYSCTC